MAAPDPTQPPTRVSREVETPSPVSGSDTGISSHGHVVSRHNHSDASEDRSEDGWLFREADIIADRFKVRNRLGRGGMGEVYEVEDLDARETRALKVMRSAIAGSDSARERFRNESRIRKLNHPHIVSTIDIVFEIQHRKAPQVFLQGL